MVFAKINKEFVPFIRKPSMTIEQGIIFYNVFNSDFPHFHLFLQLWDKSCRFFAITDYSRVVAFSAEKIGKD